MELHRRFDEEIADLRDRLLLLGGETERALQRAIHALVSRDSSAAQGVLDGDDEIDRLEVLIDRLCIDILALRQPAARDLRFVISVAKVAPILERIADHACNIARAAIALSDEPELGVYVDLPGMAGRVSEMLRAALDALTRGDAAAARRLIARDDEIDSSYERLFQELLGIMVADSSAAARAARMLFVAKHLERIGDYVTDICELTVYMTEAAFIKHSN